jgi:hypothetical protein
MKSERSALGASYVIVYCDSPECHTRIGPKIIYYKHKGYEHEGAKPMFPQELDHARNAGLTHEKQTHHEVRMIEGQLEGKIYPKA